MDDEGARYPLGARGKRILRAAMEAKGWGPTELARQSGLPSHTRATYILAEEGKNAVWGTADLPAVCRALGLDLSEVMAGLSPLERRVMRAARHAAKYAPERADELVRDLETRSQDVTGRELEGAPSETPPDPTKARTRKGRRADAR